MVDIVDERPKFHASSSVGHISGFLLHILKFPKLIEWLSLNATGFNLSHLLPDIVPCGTEVGKLTFDWEGIPAGASVYVALGDLQCSVYPFLERQKDSNGVADTNNHPPLGIGSSVTTSIQYRWQSVLAVFTYPHGSANFFSRFLIESSSPRCSKFIDQTSSLSSEELNGAASLPKPNVGNDFSNGTSAQIAFKMPPNLGFTNGHMSPSSVSSNTNNSVPPKNKSIFETLFESKRIDVWPFFKPGEKIVVAASMNGGNVIERFVKMLRFWCRQLGCPALETSQSELAAGSKTVAGSSGNRDELLLRYDPDLIKGFMNF
ncbi:hypothetical protein ACTXT7_002390 [Hymenolepis weldensis]